MHGRTGILGRTLGSLDEHDLASRLRRTRHSPSIIDGVPTDAIASAEVAEIFIEGYLAKLADLAKRIPDHLDRQAKLEKWNEARGVNRGVEKGCIPRRNILAQNAVLSLKVSKTPQAGEATEKERLARRFRPLHGR